MFDVIIVGGSNAGLSAALVLGRSRRRTLVIDHDQPRNAPSPAVHSFFSRDGTPPSELRRIGREQLRPYESVEFAVGEVVAVRRSSSGFDVTLRDGTQHAARKLLLATGVHDELPAIEGLAERWGKSVLHCPYCHGWEVRDHPLAVYGPSEIGVEFALTVRGWSDDVVLCTDGSPSFDDEQRQRLARHNIAIRDERIRRLEGPGDALEQIVFESGEALPRHALFMRAIQRQRSDIADQLGCEMEQPMPGVTTIKVDAMGKTSVPGVYAAGDAATMLQQAIVAAADGAMAAIGLNHELLQEDFA